jgi:glycosyltransferase involved in cell wall biosynthesis
MNDMLFSFLRYLQPTHYFSLLKKSGETVFPVYDCLPEVIKQQLEIDVAYTSDLAKHYDLSWQALHKGYVGGTKTIEAIETVPVMDNYIFIRKYFSRLWVLYVLCLRLLSFKQPFQEISAYLKTRSIRRSSYMKSPLQNADWDSFDSTLVVAQPKVSVIIPTLNRYHYLNDVLNDLEQQDYTNFEVIVVDQSEPFQESFYSDYKLDLTLLYQKEKALWLARNTAIKLSQGDYVLLFDDDSRVDADWIRQHLKCLDFFKADLSSGVSISQVGAKVPEHYAFFRVSDQLDTGNVLIKKEVFGAIGLFDRQFEKQRMGDGEYGLRAYLHGFLNVSNPYAKRLHLKVGTGGLREMGSWDAFRTQNWFSPRPIPSVLYFFRRYFGDQAARLALLRTVPLSMMPYQFKRNKAMMFLGVFVTLLLTPLVLFQVVTSWRLSGKKLKEGALIEKLVESTSTGSV